MRLRIFSQKGKEKQRSREQELKNIFSIKFQINSKDQVPLKEVLQRKNKRTKRQKLSSNKISQS